MRTKYSEIDSLLKNLINRLFGSNAEFHSTIIRDNQGESLVSEWTVNGWKGELSLRRQKGALTTKELGGILKFLKDINHDETDTKIQ
jgi:hypothetical protein